MALLPAQYGNTMRGYISQPWAIVHTKSIMHRHASLEYAEYEPLKEHMILAIITLGELAFFFFPHILLI